LTVAGVWDVILDALNREGGGLDAVQLIDSTVVTCPRFFGPRIAGKF
jgi:hypothetical protein